MNIPEQIWTAIGGFLSDKTSRKFLMVAGYVAGLLYLTYKGIEIPQAILGVTCAAVGFYLVANVAEKLVAIFKGIEK